LFNPAIDQAALACVCRRIEARAEVFAFHPFHHALNNAPCGRIIGEKPNDPLAHRFRFLIEHHSFLCIWGAVGCVWLGSWLTCFPLAGRRDENWPSPFHPLKLAVPDAAHHFGEEVEDIDTCWTIPITAERAVKGLLKQILRLNQASKRIISRDFFEARPLRRRERPYCASDFVRRSDRLE
jgi:hypothetical protein